MLIFNGRREEIKQARSLQAIPVSILKQSEKLFWIYSSLKSRTVYNKPIKMSLNRGCHRMQTERKLFLNKAKL